MTAAAVAHLLRGPTGPSLGDMTEASTVNAASEDAHSQ